MGSSPSAKLWFGYDLDGDEGNEALPEWFADEMFEDRVDRAMGWGEVAGWTELRDVERSNPRHEELRKTWLANLERRREDRRELNVELLSYSSGDFPSYGLYVIDSLQQATDWGSTALDVSKLAEQIPWQRQLAFVVKLLDLKSAIGDRKPAWHLATYYG